MPVALITGGSAGLGLALATALAERDWDLIIDAAGNRLSGPPPRPSESGPWLFREMSTTRLTGTN